MEMKNKEHQDFIQRKLEYGLTSNKQMNRFNNNNDILDIKMFSNTAIQTAGLNSKNTTDGFNFQEEVTIHTGT